MRVEGRAMTAGTAPQVIVIGGSAGSLTPIKRILSALPTEIAAAVFVVMHIGTDSRLPEVLRRSTPLPVSYPADGESFVAGRVYVALPDYHMMLDPDRVLVRRGPLENRVRPSVDALFRSAAYLHGERVAGVMLSGCLHDGSAGLWAIKHRGGLAIAQRPDDAEFSSMPESAIEHVQVDHIVAHDAVAPILVSWASAQATAGPRTVKRDEISARAMEIETRIAAGEHALSAGVLELGVPSRFSCPECHGVLAQIEEGTHVRFRCHTGHAYSLQSLLHESAQQGETILANALRVLEETLLLVELTDRDRSDEQRPHVLSERKLQLRQQIAAVHALMKEVTPASS